MAGNWKHTSPRQLLRSHLNRRATTRRAYAKDLSSLADFLGTKTMTAAIRKMVDAERGAAVRILEDWRADHRAKGLSLATARRRIGSVLGLLRLAHDYDIIPWAIRVRMPKAATLRNTQGPSREVIERMMVVCQQRGDAKGRRDLAILCLLFYNGLRASELLSLDLRHVDLDHRQIEIAAKGAWDREPVPIPMRTAEVLETWIETRGKQSGALFTTLQHARGSQPDRLSYVGLHHIVHDLGRAVGVACWPHALRHSAAAEMDRITNGNVAWGMALTRHRDPATFMLYSGNRLNAQRQAVEILVRGAAIRGVDPPRY